MDILIRLLNLKKLTFTDCMYFSKYRCSFKNDRINAYWHKVLKVNVSPGLDQIFTTYF